LPGAGAKVVLVGDWAQLSAVEAGGASVCWWTTGVTWPPSCPIVQRFSAEWEKAASVEMLR